MPPTSHSAPTAQGRAQLSTLKVRQQFIREVFGEAAHRRLVTLADHPLRAALTAPESENAWVDLELLVQLCELIDREFHASQAAGGSELNFSGGLILQMGRYSAQHTAGVWRSMFQRGMTVHQFVEIASGLWHRHYDCGHVRVSATREYETEMLIEGMPRPSRAHCLSVRGWLEGVFSFNPHTQVQIQEVSCRARGDARCLMRLSWNG